MTRADIRDSWLLIGDSRKRQQKEAADANPGDAPAQKRRPLGDKGLGRLGAQRLGWGLEISTKTADAKRDLVAGFSWKDFDTAPTLDKVNVDVGYRVTSRSHGSVLTISGLRDPDVWQGEENLRALQSKLSQLISPYHAFADFVVTLTVDGHTLDLRTITEQVRETAELHYDIDFDGERIVIAAKARLGFFRPSSGKELAEFRRLVDGDNGKRFLAHLRKAKRTRDLGLHAGTDGWFLTFRHERMLRDLKPVLVPDNTPSRQTGSEPSQHRRSSEVAASERLSDGPGPEAHVDVSKVAANPGPFQAEVDSFDLGRGSDARLEVFGSLQPYRDFIKEMSGVRVYRDGFGVRVDKDWLGLGEQWTSASSYYGLKPGNTMGYVAISSRANPQLVENTDREGFKDTPHYRNFRTLLGMFVDFTIEVQGALRREWVAFRTSQAKASAEVGASATPESVTADIDAVLGEAEGVRRTVAAARQTAARWITQAGDSAPRPTDAPAAVLARSREAADRLMLAGRETEAALSKLDEYLERLAGAQRKAEVLRLEIASLRDQLGQSVETMSLGLTAEALSHEMFNVADGLASRTTAIRDHLTSHQVEDGEIRRYVEHVRGAVATLRKELAHFSPSLRFVRERRQVIDITELVDDVASYFARRWDGEIKLRVKPGRTSFRIRSSRGKLIQVLDNLLLNSEYWLRAAVQQKAVDGPEVLIELTRPFIRVLDNGPGVDPSAENSLFEPFVTRKPRGQGRGLGLFVSKQLLESEGASIDLASVRNAQGHRFRFDIDLSPVLHDS